MTGFEPVPQGLEGPRATVTPHSLWFGLRVSNPSLHAGNVECVLHTQAERGPVSFTGPSTPVSFQRPRSFELVDGDSARSRTRTHELWRLGCSRYTTLPTSPHVSTVSTVEKRHTLPLAWPVSVHGREAKTKKAF